MDEICHEFQHDIEESVPKAIAQKILNNLFNQKASGQFCDVQFLHGSATVWAHSCVLASYSPYMLRLFTKYAEENVYWSFNKPIQVNISSVTKCNGSSRNNCVDCTCKIIDFIYTGKIKLDPKHLDHVVNLSNNLEIDVLLLICQRYKRDHYSLLDSLPETNQISTGVGCENTVDFKAYVDNLNNSVSYSFYLSSEKCELTNDLKSKSDIDSNYRKRYSTDITSNNAKRSNNQVEFRHYNNAKSKSNEYSVKTEEYICRSCNFRSENNDKLKLHKRVFHRRNYICVECEYTSFKMAEIIDHALKNSHGGNMCTVCLYEADNFLELKAHLTEHNRIFPFKCTMCEQRFKYRNDWIRHLYSPFHRNDLQISLDKPTISSSTIVEETQSPTITNLSVTSTPSPQSPVKPEENKPNHACRICKYEFSCAELLQKHNHIFHKRKYICLSCDFNTFKIESIIEHLIELRHEENVCSICLYVANDVDSLMEHIVDHKNPQPFSCTVCSTRFQTRNEWWRHELAHGSEKPFKCHYCDQSFPTSSYLNTHIIYTHKQKKHKCKVCGYGAPFASKLEKHSLTHRNKYTCNINNCTFSCTSEVLLKKHKKVHVLKPLACPVCSLKFKFVKNMKRHIKLIHNSDSFLLKCPICEYTNGRIDKMKEHCRNLHDNDKNILEKINKQYEEIKHYILPEAVKKRRTEKVNLESNTVLEDKEKVTDDSVVKSNDEGGKSNFVCGTVNDSMKQTVLLSESTGELNIMCENEGKPIAVASVTSTNMLTIGNFREGTGTVTLNETTGVLTFNNINMDSKGAVFLNESTGVLSYINLNIENPSEPSNETEQVVSEQVQLNEVTGEIVTVTEENTTTTKTINQIPDEEDFPFDSFGFDFNEDSYDGFDEFDNLFFDTFSTIDQTTSSSSNVEEILENNTTNRFFAEHTPRLDEMTGELTFNKDSIENNNENIWSSVNTFPENSIMETVNTEVYGTLLNEVTGEFS